MPDHSPPIAFACPRCSSPLPAWASGTQTCATCGTRFEFRNGIYRFLLPERLQAIRPFLSQYRLVREKDGCRSRPPEAYRSLPLVDSRDPQAGTWRVRAETFAHLRRHALPHLKREVLHLLDLGAGNGWLSHRLAALGHRCVAVDWLDDAEDGLGAFAHYPVTFTCVQADFDRLPFQPGQFDLVIFNASLHYAPDVYATLRHARQMLAPGGALAIMDSPTFQTDEGGRRMLAEREAEFRARYGLAEVVHWGEGYLTPGRLAEVGSHLGMPFRFIPSRGGPGWVLRRCLAGLKKRREPARFGLWVGGL